MGASGSKLNFKQGVFRLSQHRHIPADDPYWTSFWELPENAEDVFSLISPADIRRTRDHALENIETLILALTSRLFALRHHPSFPDPELAPDRQLLNCVRVLSRTLPFLYETETLGPWHDRYFWGGRRKRTRKSSVTTGNTGEVLFDGAQPEQQQDGDETRPRGAATADDFEESRPLAKELIDTLIDLLFFSNFTVPQLPPDMPKVSYNIWQSGVGCNTALPTTKELESNRCEILRLLLVLAGQSMYMAPNVLPQVGVRALTYMCTCPDKQIVLSVLCSLLNTTLKYNPVGWRVPYNTLVFKESRQLLATYSLHTLLVLLLYPVRETPPASANARPNSGSAPLKNFYRHFLGRLHRPQDFQFLVDGMSRILNQPLQEKTSYIPEAVLSSSAGMLAPAVLMLFWEMTQCNKRFRAFMVDTQRAYDLVVLSLYYALEKKTDAPSQGVVRMCVFLLQTLSVEKNFGANLNRHFEGQNSLPATVRIQGFRGTYGDFLIQSIYNLISTSQGKLSATYPALLAIINNIAPQLKGLSTVTSLKLMRLFSSMSSPSFLLATESNHNLLRSLLESINSILEHRYKENPQFVYAVLRNKKRIDALRTFTLESGQEEIEKRKKRRKEGVDIDLQDVGSGRSSTENPTSPTSVDNPRTPVEQDPTFAIGGDDDEDDDNDDEDNEEQKGSGKGVDGKACIDGPRPVPVAATVSDNASRVSPRNLDDSVPSQLRVMSEKARGKLPAGSGMSFSRKNSTASMSSYVSANAGSASEGFEPSPAWIGSWLPGLPLHTLLTVLQQLTSTLPPQQSPTASEHPAPETIRQIQELRLVGIEPSPPRVHSFEWTSPALGWYASLLWGLVFVAEMQVARGAVGVWNGTAIRLFRVRETAAEGPSLMSPRGAVDAVGSSIVSRIGSINLGSVGPGGRGGDGGDVGDGDGNRNDAGYEEDDHGTTMGR